MMLIMALLPVVRFSLILSVALVSESEGSGHCGHYHLQLKLWNRLVSHLAYAIADRSIGRVTWQFGIRQSCACSPLK